MDKNVRNKLIYKGLAITWFIFGIVFLALPLLGGGDSRSITLGIIACLLFFITSYLNWKRFKETNIK
jgi:hypothetical protein